MSIEKRCAAVILAAGKGTRMRSPRPKVLHTLLGSPMLAYVLRALEPVFGSDMIVISGHMAAELESAIKAPRYVRQQEQLGTAHALMTAMPALVAGGFGAALVINGDAPLVTTADIAAFMDGAAKADIAFATIELPDAGAYGRVVRKDGRVAAIVEAKDFDPARDGPDSGEVNAGLYYITVDAATRLLPQIGNVNASGEYYITDLIGLALAAGMSVRTVPCANASLMGVNSPAELARAEDDLASRTATELLAAGVIIHNPGQLRASPFCRIAPGSEISAPCEIQGSTAIEAGSEVGPYCVIRDSTIRAGAKILAYSHLDQACVGENATVGPFGRLRPGATLAAEAHVGNFVELKKTTLGRGAKANHLAYLGDSEIGDSVNIGAGAITCNYDGKNKSRTVIGEHAFIGSNSSLVAPVTIGQDALVAAGSVITRDVPPHATAFGRSRQVNKPEE